MSMPAMSAIVRHYVQTDDSVPRLFDAYYKTNGELTATSVFDYANELCLAARDGMAGAMAGWLAGDSRYIGCTCHIQSGAGVGSSLQLNPLGEEGELEGDSCPDYVGAIIRRYTLGNDPSFRGRVFIPAVAEINTDTSRLNTAGKAALLAIRDALDAQVTTPGGEFGTEVNWEAAHYNRKNAQVTNILQWVPVDVLATQRRRRLRPLQ